MPSDIQSGASVRIICGMYEGTTGYVLNVFGSDADPWACVDVGEPWICVPVSHLELVSASPVDEQEGTGDGRDQTTGGP